MPWISMHTAFEVANTAPCGSRFLYQLWFTPKRRVLAVEEKGPCRRREVILVSEENFLGAIPANECLFRRIAGLGVAYPQI